MPNFVSWITLQISLNLTCKEVMKMSGEILNAINHTSHLKGVGFALKKVKTLLSRNFLAFESAQVHSSWGNLWE